MNMRPPVRWPKKALHALLVYASAYWYSFTTHGHQALKASEHECTADNVFLSIQAARVMVHKKETRYVLTCGFTAVLVFMAAVRVLSIACIVRLIDDSRITTTCGFHCGFTSAQYCDIHGVHSQHLRYSAWLKERLTAF